MNINIARKMVIDNIGIFHRFVFRGSRNQIEEFSGIITKCFPRIFLIKISDGTIKSFSYSDLLVNNLKIIS